MKVHSPEELEAYLLWQKAGLPHVDNWMRMWSTELVALIRLARETKHEDTRDPRAL